MSEVKKRGLLCVAIVAATICLTGALALCGCAPEGSSDDDAPRSKDAEAATQAVAWSIDSDCSTCHATEEKSLSDASYLCSMHDRQGLSCLNCHTDESTLTDVHSKAKDLTKTATKLKKTEVERNACESCHDSAELMAATADLALLTDDNGLTVNPHDLPTNSEHDVIDCATCHSMHSTEKADTLAPDKCLSCHHQNVYECHTCHS